MICGLIVLAGLVLFAEGQTLFGSDPGTIDSYNRAVLETCEIPAESTLLRTYILPIVTDTGLRLRSMSYIYASPLPAGAVAGFFDITGPGIWARAAEAPADTRSFVLLRLAQREEDGLFGLEPFRQLQGVSPADAGGSNMAVACFTGWSDHDRRGSIPDGADEAERGHGGGLRIVG